MSEFIFLKNDKKISKNGKKVLSENRPYGRTGASRTVDRKLAWPFVSFVAWWSAVILKFN